jgi:rhomboid family protein
VLAFPHLRDAVQRFGLIPAEAGRLDGLTFITSFFLHAGVIHLVGNMYFLLVFGNNVEDFLRPLRYLALIALAAFIGDLTHILADRTRKSRASARAAALPGSSRFTRSNFHMYDLGFCSATGSASNGSGFPRGLFLSFGFCSKLSAPGNKKPESVLSHRSRIWAARPWALSGGYFGEKGNRMTKPE